MATLLQKRLAEEIVSDVKTGRQRNKKQLVVSSGYTEMSAKSSAHLILEQKGVKDALQDLGFTTDGADSVVKKIMYGSKKEENRLRAADMVYKRLGDYKDTGQGASKTLVINISGETAKRYDITPNTSDSGA